MFKSTDIHLLKQIRNEWVDQNAISHNHAVIADYSKLILFYPNAINLRSAITKALLSSHEYVITDPATYKCRLSAFIALHCGQDPIGGLVSKNLPELLVNNAQNELMKTSSSSRLTFHDIATVHSNTIANQIYDKLLNEIERHCNSTKYRVPFTPDPKQGSFPELAPVPKKQTPAFVSPNSKPKRPASAAADNASWRNPENDGQGAWTTVRRDGKSPAHGNSAFGAQRSYTPVKDAQITGKPADPQTGHQSPKAGFRPSTSRK